MITSLPIEVELQADAKKRELTFYGAQIGNRDGQSMRCMPGAFSQSINTRLPQGLIKLCRNHEDRNSGVIRHAEEDSFGLLCIGYVSKTQAGDDLLEQVTDGSLTHCSFRGSVIRGQWVIDGEDDYGHPIETLNLLEIKLKETGPVDFDPANMGATILAVKSLAGDMLDDIRELPLLLKSMTVGRGRVLTSDERRIAKSLLQLRESLGEHGDVLEALLAPGSTTPPHRAAPVRPTQEAVEKADHAGLDELLTLIRRRGQLQP
jgi:HK97 family phage prohead protease